MPCVLKLSHLVRRATYKSPAHICHKHCKKAPQLLRFIQSSRHARTAIWATERQQVAHPEAAMLFLKAYPAKADWGDRKLGTD